MASLITDGYPNRGVLHCKHQTVFTATAKLLSSYQVWSVCILILITIAESPSAQIWKCRNRQSTTLAFIAVRKETICAFLLLNGRSKDLPQVFMKVSPKQTVQMHE